jgi:hypothetical protein
MSMTAAVPMEGNGRDDDDKAEHIQGLMEYARTNYQVNPTDSLAALLEAMTLNTGSRHVESKIQSHTYRASSVRRRL